MAGRKVALVTGGTSGIGAATCLELAKSGYDIVVSGRRADLGEQVEKEVKGEGASALFVQCDVSQEGQCRALVQHAVERFGRLDVAVNNSGVGTGMAPLVDKTTDNFQKELVVNVLGCFWCMQEEIKQFLKQGQPAAIVNVSSIYGVVGCDGQATYVASKHAVSGLTKSAALDYAHQGIRVNAVAPGIIETPMTTGITSDPQKLQYWLAKHPLHRLGKPEEVAAGIAFLASDAASFITGVVLPIDGGYTAE